MTAFAIISVAAIVGTITFLIGHVFGLRTSQQQIATACERAEAAGYELGRQFRSRRDGSS